MILYFSATGNCKYVATRLAEATGEEILSIVDCIQQGRYSFSDTQIGIVSPTYWWALPSLMQEFLQKASLQAQYIYYVATYGTTPGASGHFAQKFLGQPIQALFSVRMPDTWTAIFDLSTQEKVDAFSTTTESDIDAIITHLQQHDCGNFMTKRKNPLLVSLIHQDYNRARKTNHFIVEDSCIGCGLCAKKCPIEAIEMRDGKPTWVKDQCVLCLGCLHRCPKFAIQYGNRTQSHGQYTNPHVKI